MPEDQILTSWKIWTLAARPKTLPAAGAPVLLGTALAYWDGEMVLVAALVSLLCALLLQIGSNLANDVFDFQRGADAGDRQGPVRVTQNGLLSPGQVKAGMWVVFAAAGLCGVYLSWVSSWYLILIGALAILAALGYSGGPLPFGYVGLGDVFVLVFFGLVAVGGTYYVQAKSLSLGVAAMSLAMGALVTNILVVNNLRDIPQDKEAGKRTLAVVLGPTATRVQYLVNLGMAYGVPVWLVVWGKLPEGAVLVLLSLLYAGKLVGQIYRWEGKALNQSLTGTGRLALLYALLFALGGSLFPG